MHPTTHAHTAMDTLKPREPYPANEVLPLEASTDSALNRYTLRCEVTHQAMHYPACLWRQKVLANDQKAPSDWEPCRTAAKCNGCTALRMRDKELQAGKSLYFLPAGYLGSSMSWPLDWPERDRAEFFAPTPLPKSQPGRPRPPVYTPAPAPEPAPAPKKSRAKPVDLTEAMGSVGDYADAVNRLAAAPKVAPTPAPVASAEPAKPAPKPAAAGSSRPPMLPGESPLAYALRVKQMSAQPTA